MTQIQAQEKSGVRIGNEGEHGRAGDGSGTPEASDKLRQAVNSLPDALHSGRRGPLFISLGFPKLSLPVAMGTFMLRP